MGIPASRESVWRKWSALSPGQRLLLIRAGFWLPVFSLAVELVPLRRIMTFLGLSQVTAGDVPASSIAPAPRHAPASRAVDSLLAVDVARAISVVGGRLPWTSKCLAQALTGARLLHGSALQATITLGVAKGSSDGPDRDPVLAHAWLDHGDANVTGGAQQSRFLPVGRFVG